ncbi:MAG: NADH-quinone oxidoreductase subunit N [Candidatus Thorarchaeota archaeon]
MQDLILGLIPENVFSFSWVLIILAGILVVLLLEYLNIKRFHLWIGIITLISAMVPLIWYLAVPATQGIQFFYGFVVSGSLNYNNSVIVIDHFTAFMGLLFLIVNTLVLLASTEFMKKEENLFVFTSLMLLATLGMIFVASTIDVVVLVVAWELVSIPSYILVAFKKNERESTEAAVKFFIVGAVSSAMMLFGASLLYGLNPFGTTNYYVLMKQVTLVPSYLGGIVLVGVTFVVAGLGFKMGTVPFHWWLPDAYEGALTPVTTMLAAASKKVGFAAGFRVLLIPVMLSWNIATSTQVMNIIVLIFTFVAIFTMIVGNIGALVQTKMKRLLAYSSIGQAGYIMLAIASFDQRSFTGGLYHVFAHAFMTIGAFICVMIVTSRTGTDDIADYKGLGKRMPWTSLVLSLSFLSLAGIPPFVGFASKLWIFLGALDNGGISSILYVGALIMVITSAISVYYYVRVIKYMVMDEPPDNLPDEIFQKAPRVPFAYWFPLIITTAVVVLFGLFASPFLDFLNLVQQMAWSHIIV